MKRNIGVLALQGDFEKHKFVLKKCGADVKEVKKPEQLKKCDGLIIPGGESTTLTKLMKLYGFYEVIRDFAGNYPVMGTCAGMIMLSSKVDDVRVAPLKLINIKTSRNAYGRQINSFVASVYFLGKKIKTYFIRAPKVIEVGQNVNVLTEYKGEAVAVQQNNIFAISFHPELGSDISVHKYFLERV